jgi:hypothetical protein
VYTNAFRLYKMRPSQSSRQSGSTSESSDVLASSRPRSGVSIPDVDPTHTESTAKRLFLMETGKGRSVGHCKGKKSDVSAFLASHQGSIQVAALDCGLRIIFIDTITMGDKRVVVHEPDPTTHMIFQGLVSSKATLVIYREKEPRGTRIVGYANIDPVPGVPWRFTFRDVRVAKDARSWITPIIDNTLYPFTGRRTVKIAVTRITNLDDMVQQPSNAELAFNRGKAFTRPSDLSSEKDYKGDTTREEKDEFDRQVQEKARQVEAFLIANPV